MHRDRVRTILASLLASDLTIEEVVEALSLEPITTAKDAMVDTHRALRTGQPEAIFGETKTPEQIISILKALQTSGQNGLVTRIDPDTAATVCEAIPNAQWLPIPRLVVLHRQQPKSPEPQGRIAIVCAGTSDLAVSQEAEVTARLCGHHVDLFTDVGVAGIHRLLHVLPQLRSHQVIIAVAGMEGALPSVLAGLVDQPVIAVPTSVGYGANLQGITALLGMMCSCAAGVSVVNIDNGFGAAMLASRIIEQILKGQR